ncbi:carboxypeptidase regulatory-like domain-containing protein, partial [bacterium]|nr:carboxypeptidase regulatory-like domain-containing protein [bacterium]
MKNLTITLCLLMCANVIFAQPEVIWSEAYGGGGGDQGLAIIQTSNGQIAVSGNEGSFGDGGTDGWLMILDLDGEEVWSAYGGGRGYDRFYGIIEIDGGFVVSGYEGSFGAGNYDFWLSKFTEEGEAVWENAFGGREHERANKVIQTENGGFVFTGKTESFGDGNGDGWVVATDSEGNEAWTQTYGGNGVDGLSSICHADEGNIMLAGVTDSEGEGGNDFYIVKINGDGDVIWSHTFGGDGDEQCQSIKRTNDDCYILAGITTSFAENGTDYWLVKINEDGEEIWSANFDNGANDLCRSVIQTFDGGYLLAGHNNLYDNANCDGWLVRTDDEGELLWSQTYDAGDQADVFVDVVQLDDGGYAVTGWSSSFGLGGLDFWVTRFGPEPAGVLYGVVTDAATEEPVEGATIITTNGLSAETDEDGFYWIEPAWAGDFSMTASIPGYNDSTIFDLGLDFDDTLEVNFNLLHPEFEVSRDEFEWELQIDETQEFNFSAANNGNGPLEYRVDKRLLGEANAEPFELRRSDEIEGLLNDDMLAGAVILNEQFYVSGGNNGDGTGKIYVLDQDREVVGEFDQFVEDRYGMRDLTTDGELIWGAVEGTFYGFNPEGELVTSFEVDVNLEGRAITWDPVNNVLLASDISTDIYAIGRDGEIVETYRRPEELRIYGLGYYPNDPDGYNLYIFCRGPDNVGIDLFKLDLESSDYTLIAHFDAEGRPSGLQITNQLDVYSWVIIGLVQNTDALTIWQLDGRKEWFDVDPNEGVIEADESQEFTLTFSSAGLPPDNLFQGEAVFMHNAMQAETAISIELGVVEGIVQTSREIDLHIGWNTVSTNLQPNDHENIEGLVASLVENDLLIMMKNGSGDFYRPEYEFNNIQAWNSWEGYQMLMSGAAVLELDGMSVLRDDPIDLTEGWQLISYYPRFEVEATLALSGIVDHLIIAKDGYGNFYLPEWDHFSNMGNMREGQGYYIKVDEDIRLVYVTQEQEEERSANSLGYSSVYDKSGELPVHPVTGSNMSLLVLTDPSIEGEIGIYASDVLVGSGVIQNGKCGIAIWGDDESTDVLNGAKVGDELEIRLLSNGHLQNAAYTLLSGELNYQINGLAVIRLDDVADLPVEFGIVSAYPNPFNSTTMITYSLPEAALVSLKLYDISGREVASIVNEYRKAGLHETIICGENLSSGLYFL